MSPIRKTYPSDVSDEEWSLVSPYRADEEWPLLFPDGIQSAKETLLPNGAFLGLDRGEGRRNPAPCVCDRDFLVIAISVFCRPYMMGNLGGCIVHV